MIGAISLFKMITPSSGQALNSVQAIAKTQPSKEQSPREQVQISQKAKDLATGKLSPEDEEQVKKLKERDQHVRMHEQAHLAAAGPYAKGAPKFDFQQGPDQKQYAVGGEVSIDTSRTGKPESDLNKAKTLKAAASAPADPSAQDQKVSAAASQMEQDALSKLQKKQQNSATYGPNRNRNQNSVLGQGLDLSA